MLDLKSKLLITIGTVFLIAFGILTYIDYQETRAEIAEALLNEARSIRGMMTATRRVYRHQFMISGLPLNEDTIGFLPAHALSRISTEFSNRVTSGLSFNNVSDKPRNPALMADKVELQAIQFFRTHPDQRERMTPFTTDEGKSFYHFSTPLWITKDCLKCHGKREDAPPSIQKMYDTAYDYKLGDLRGILSIKLPAEELERRALKQVWNSGLNYLLGFLCTLLAVFLLLKRTVLNRISALTAATSRLASGDYDTRLVTHGADEITRVSSAFNSMAEAIASRTRHLEESEQRTRSIVDAAAEGILLIDDSGIVLESNPAASVIFGESKLSLIGKPLTQLIPDRALSGDLKTLKQLAKTQTAGPNSQQPIEANGRRGDGISIQLELTISPVLIRDQHLYLCMVQNISMRKQAEQAVQDKQQFLQSVIDGVVDPIMVIRHDYQIIMMNRAARNRLPSDAPPERIYHCYEVSHNRGTPCSGDAYPCPLSLVMASKQPVTLMHEHHCKTHGARLFELNTSPFWEPEGTLTGVIQISKDITDRLKTEQQLKDNEERLHHQAQHDALTGLPNRLLFHDRLEHAMHKAHRTHQQVAVLFLDLDRFKNINDGLGHDVGDGMLKEVADRLQSAIREDDTVARLGGDEFVIILEELTDPGSAASVASKCLNTLSQKMVIKGIEIFPTVSIGISLFPGDEITVDGLMKCADTAMYRAKDAGRNSFQFYTRDMNDQTIKMLLLEGSLRHALSDNQLRLFYQPKFDLIHNRLIGMEALIRWQHPEKGMISPADFIPLAEETGMIIAIGEWVINQACRQIKQWQAFGIDQLHVAVNISARHFNPLILDTIAQALRDNKLAPHFLELEITESVLMDNADSAVEILTQLREMGISLSIDDFGTGYSSLSYLKRFPIASLKIDRSFVMDVTHDSNDAAIVSSIVALAKSMDLQVTAEGVETAQQLEFIKQLGCDFGQGYLLGRPVPADEFEQRYLQPALVI